MIHIIYGTRAELIKLSTIIEELEKRKIEFKLIDNGQHDTEELRKSLKIRKPDYFLGKSLRKIWSKLESSPVTYPVAVLTSLVWGTKVFFKLLNILSREGGLVIFHGNTMSVPLVIGAAKFSRRKIRLVHFESGLRANTRRSILLDKLYKFGDHHADYLFVPYKSCEKNLRKEKVKGKILYSGDVMFDVVKRNLKFKTSERIPKTKYVVANFTRSILTKKDAEEIITTFENLKHKILGFLNPVIENRLKQFDLIRKLRNLKNVNLKRSIPYIDFLHLIKNSDFVITDSAGVEEECVALGKFCIVTNDFIQFRELENSGLIKMSGCNSEKILEIINSNEKNLKTKLIIQKSATKIIADYLENIL